jgi:hypothetical protein
LIKRNGSHYTYATAWVNVKADFTPEAAEKLIEDLGGKFEVLIKPRYVALVERAFAATLWKLNDLDIRGDTLFGVG